MKTSFMTNTYTMTLLTSVVVMLAAIGMQAQTLYINEFMASNQSTITDEFGEFDDWVEIYNPGTSPIDIGGMYMTDDTTETNLWQIPTTNASLTTIPAGGYLLVWFDKDTDQGELHINAKLGSSGEDIGLYASDGTTMIDAYTFGQQLTDVSEGRDPDGGPSWVLYGVPTPGATNDTPPGVNKTEIPVADIGGGLYTGSVTITLTSATQGADIYYTLDATDPTDNSIEYTGPITMTDITPVRAKAYSSSLLPSDVMTETYLIDVAHDFAIVALNTDTTYLYDDEIGIFTNFEEEIENPAHIQFFEPDGTLAFSQDIEIEIHGTASAALPQKSLKLKAKASYGNEFFNYPIFPDRPFNQYRSFLIRQSGQDWNNTMFRDAFEAGLLDDVSDLNGVLEEPDLDLQGYRPGVVYLNGEYWGIYNVREQMNWKYLNVHYGIQKDEVDVVEDEDELEEGDLVEWESFNAFLENNNFSGDANYEILKDKADVKHFMDYTLHGLILDNNDWPGNNNKHYRERKPDAKWRWMTKDLDFGFGLRPLNAPWNSGDFTTDMVEVCLAENSSNYYNPPESTLLLRRLMENDNSKNYFINRAADFLNTVFVPSRVIDRIDAFETVYTPEMQAHFDRWQSGWNGHAANVEVLRTFANGRQGAVRGHFDDYFSEITGTTDVTVDANPTNGGFVELSTLHFEEPNFPWSGVYFQDIDIPLRAKPARGFVLDSWSIPGLGNALETVINITSGTEDITANFIPGSTATDPIVINEINYNSPDFPNPEDWVELHNPNSFSVDISGWYFEDESGDYFGLPANTVMPAGGYLLLVEDEESFTAVYPNAPNVFASFGKDPGGFGLSGGGELITLKNAASTLIDEVEYDDNSPWPDEPDGDGPTLQLIDPAMDNMLPESWIAFPATPGSLNGVTPVPQDQAIDFPEIDDQVTFAPPFDLGATATSGLPVSYTVLSGPATVAGSVLTLDGTVGAVVVRASQAGDANYYAAVDVEQTFYVFEFVGGPEGYCDSEGNAPWQEWISNVQFNTINHSSGKTQYSDFTNVGTFVEQGLSYPITITPTFSGTIFNEYFTVWIDYNQDGDFEDAGEEVFMSSSSNDSPQVGNISIPLPTQLGATRMRIAMKRDTYADPCETFAKGEVEDYTLVITEAAEVLTFSCPANINATVSGSTTETVVSWTEPAGSTTCASGIVTVTQTAGPASGSLFPVGTTTIEYEATDDCGNVVTCSFTVTVTVDNGTLSLTCPANIDVTVSGGATGALVTWTEPTPGTSCPLGGAAATQTGGPANGAFFPIGTTTVSYEATDLCGNVETCEFTVTITLDNGTLTLTCPADIEVLVPAGSTGEVVTWTEPSVSTTCPLGGAAANQTAGPANGDVFPLGVTTVSYEGIDLCGNVENCSFTVTVSIDNGTLTFGCNPDVTVVALPGAPTEVVTWSEPAASTTCATGGLAVTQTAGPASGSTFAAGTTTTITYEAVDNCGNLEICNFNVTVTATPVTISLTCPANISVPVDGGDTGAVVSWSDPTVSTDCYLPGSTLTQTEGMPSGSFFLEGDYTISYEVVDACGAIATCSFMVSVTGNIGTLSLTCPPNQTFTIPVGQSSMVVNWPLPETNTTCGGGPQNPNCGSTPTGFTLLGTQGDQEYYLSDGMSPWDAAQADCASYGGYLTSIGSAAENQFLFDNIPAVIHIGMNDIDTEGTLAWTSGEAVGYTNFSSNSNNTANKDRTYMASWSGKWKFYSGSAHKQYVMELDCGGGSTVTLTQTGGPANGSTLTAGVYTITYEAMDDCGDVLSCSFDVTVEEDLNDLMITCPANISAQETPGAGGAVVTFPDATASSNTCPGSVVVTQTGGLPSGSFFTIGEHIITYTATADCSTDATCSFVIRVEGVTPPGDYCEARGTSPWQQYIGNVSFNTINNDSGKEGYGDFTGIATNVDTDASYTFSLTPVFTWTHWDEYIRVWIDYNGDLDFDDAGEMVFEDIYVAGTSGSAATPVTGTITIPTEAPAGSTRMRVAMKKEAYADPCEIFTFGEVEDYTVVVNFNGSNQEAANSEILFFNAMKNRREVALDWVTNTEFKNDYFVIEHSLDGEQFNVLTEVESREDVTSERMYQQEDTRPAYGINFYRLKQVYYDGSHRYSSVRAVEFNVDLDEFGLFPNPAEEEVYINLNEWKGMAVDVQLINALGQTVVQKQVDEIPEEAIRIDLSSIKNGLYFISVKVEDRKRMTQQLVIMKRY